MQAKQRFPATSRSIGRLDAETEAGAGWADRLASMVKDWVINALAERLALAMISALA